MINKIRVDGDLMFEVTRRCNMDCAHCLRGDSEDIDMTTEIVDKVFENISGAECVVFSGGEPFLNMPLIHYIVDKIIKEKLNINSFWLATNGLIYDSSLINKLIDLFAYCNIDNYWVEKSVLCDNRCGLSVSIDGFHRRAPVENILKFKALGFYDKSKEYTGTDSRNFRIMNKGRAADNGLGVYDGNTIERFSYIKNNRVISVDGYIYINAKGDVLPCCDLSYEEQDEYKLGNIMSNDLENIIIRNERE